MDSVESVERFAEEVASSAGVGRVPGRPNPTRIATGLIVRQPQDVGFPGRSGPTSDV